jgi:hypothetical protein
MSVVANIMIHDNGHGRIHEGTILIIQDGVILEPHECRFMANSLHEAALELIFRAARKLHALGIKDATIVTGNQQVIDLVQGKNEPPQQLVNHTRQAQTYLADHPYILKYVPHQETERKYKKFDRKNEHYGQTLPNRK